MQKFQLSIPKPCHQNWNDMTPEGQGRFCSSCAKQVIDFSAMTDTQLMLHFASSQAENVCGRVHPDQLNRAIAIPEPPRKKVFLYWQYALAFVMFFFAKSQQTRAQSSIRKTALQPIAKIPLRGDVRVVMGGMRRAPETVPEPKAPAAVKWLAVTDAEENPIPYASARFLPSGNTISADSAGILHTGRYFKEDSIQITSVGFEEQTIALKNIAAGRIILARDIQKLEGVIVSAEDFRLTAIAGGITYKQIRSYSIKDTLQNIRSVFNPAITAYPNPVKKGNTINLALKLKQTGPFVLQVTNAAGELLLMQNHQSAATQKNLTLNIPAAWSSGIYFISIADEKNKLRGTTRFMVE
jgi:Secretion system C-terminal sorting domain